MSIPDPVTTGLVIAGALQVAKQAQDFIDAAAGHPGETIGTILGALGRRRLENVETVGNKAHLILLDIGVAPNEIPLNILQPLLEGASLQEDIDLQSTWANLLANAADPRENKSRVEPLFPVILSQLSSREVRYLDALFKELDGLRTITLPIKNLMLTYEKAKLSRHPIHTGAHHRTDVYDSLRGGDKDDFKLMMDVLELHRLLVKEPNSGQPLDYTLSALGLAFFQACQRPSAKD